MEGRIRRALLSVFDKTGIEDFARKLAELGVELISSGGTAKALGAAGLKVRDVQELTGYPAMLGHRVVTLHPKVHGGILVIRDDASHQADMAKYGIEGIDLVCVGLYPFEQAIAKPGATPADAVEMIDIGGPAMVRAAAKNHKYVTVVTDPSQYDAVLSRPASSFVSGWRWRPSASPPTTTPPSAPIWPACAASSSPSASAFPTARRRSFVTARTPTRRRRSTSAPSAASRQLELPSSWAAKR
jgi:hypothetical protein